MIPANYIGAATPLGPGDLADAAKAMGVEPAVVAAVCDVESAGSGFLPDRRPKILFEAHTFHTLTKGQWDRTHPNVSSPVWDHSLYGAAGAPQYDRLAEAYALASEAAWRAASWGRFQIMGDNYAAAGFADAEGFVEAMCASERAHLDAFCAFCKHGNLVRLLVAKNWIAFARQYNGPGQVEHYAAALASAYKRHAV